MSPLQRIAMGMVIVVGTAMFPADPSPSWERYDALPDPVGWVLVLWGVFALARTDDAFDGSRWLAGLAAAVSVPMWLPQVHHRLDASGDWAASLPQLAFCVLLARTIGMVATTRRPPDTFVAQRFGLLIWGFAASAVLPVVALGGRLTALQGPTLVIATLTNVAFVYYLFRVHRREWLGGPGPVEAGPGRGSPRSHS